MTRQLFDEASQAAPRADDISRLRAILFLDLAVETLLNVLIEEAELDSSDDLRPDIAWKTLAQRGQEAARKLRTEIPNLRRLGRMHEVRNLAQHNSTVPSVEDVARYLTPVRVACERVFKEAFGCSFANIRRWDLVPNDQIREQLARAASEIEAEDSRTPVERCAVVHARLLQGFKETTLRHGYSMLEFKLHSLRDGMRPRPFDQEPNRRLHEASEKIVDIIGSLFTELSDRVGDLEIELLSVALGTSILDTRRFARVMTGIHINYYPGRKVERIWLSNPPSLDDTRFVIDFTVDLIVSASVSFPEVVQAIELPLLD